MVSHCKMIDDADAHERTQVEISRKLGAAIRALILIRYGKILWMRANCVSALYWFSEATDRVTLRLALRTLLPSVLIKMTDNDHALLDTIARLGDVDNIIKRQCDIFRALCVLRKPLDVDIISGNKDTSHGNMEGRHAMNLVKEALSNSEIRSEDCPQILMSLVPLFEGVAHVSSQPHVLTQASMIAFADSIDNSTFWNETAADTLSSTRLKAACMSMARGFSEMLSYREFE